MFKKIAAFALSVLAITGGVIGFTTHATPPQQENRVPTHVLYRHLFHHVVALDKKAKEVEQNNEDGSKYRSFYKNKANLTDEQSKLLQEIASSCDGLIAQKDEEAKQIIETARAQLPGRKLSPGQTPPPPPVELKRLQEERDAIILQARDNLRTAFGEQEFQRFDGFVEVTLGPQIEAIPPNLARPKGPQQPQLLPPGSHRGAKKEHQ